MIQKHLDASAVRLYVVASGYSTDGGPRAVEGELVQLAQALARWGSGGGAGAGCRTPSGQQDPCAHGDYLCPRHEPVGSSSVLLRQALVSKVSVVLRCGTRAVGSAADRASSETPAAAASPSHNQMTHSHHHLQQHAPRSLSVAATSNSVGSKPAFPGVAAAFSAAATGGSSSGYSSCTAHAEFEAAAAAQLDARCCPDLDLTEADAAPGSATLFAAVPLVYGMATLGVLWIAVPAPADEDAPAGELETGVVNAGEPTAGVLPALQPPLAATAGTEEATGVQPPATAAAPPSQQQACSAGRGAAAAAATGGMTRFATRGSSVMSAASGPAALLGNIAALELLAMSVAMHLAAGCSETAYLTRLGEALRGLAESATLAELVLELSNSLVRHVRHRFFVDATAHAALVPALDSRVAFMLRPERVEGFGSARGVRHQLTQSRLRMASVASVPSSNNLLSNLGGAAEVNRSRSMTLAAAHAAAMSGAANGSSSKRGAAATAVNVAVVSGNINNNINSNMNSKLPDLQRAYATAAPGDGHTAPTRACSLSALRASVPRDVFMLESSVVRSDGSFGLLSSFPAPGGGAGGGLPPPSLSARAFRLSNTLLQAMLQASHQQQQHRGGGGAAAAAAAGGSSSLMSNNRMSSMATPTAPAVDRIKLVPQSFDGSSRGSGVPAGGAGGVLAGLCVRDCARHVQDERQPSRDVCMLMMTSGGRGGAGDGTNAGGGGGGAVTARGMGAAMVSESAVAVAAAAGGGGSGGGGAQSLVLLGMETGDGAVLAVYLAFPTPAPMQLLEAVRDGCSVLLGEHLAQLVRHRLRCADLAAEWDTLRAGVPGSYLSVSRCSVVPPEPQASVANAIITGGSPMPYVQSPLSQPSARRAAPLLMMSAGSNVIAATAAAAAAAAATHGGEEQGFLHDALSSCRGMASPRGRGALGSVPGSAPMPAVAGSEASLASLAPGMGGQGQVHSSQQCLSQTGHVSASTTGRTSGAGAAAGGGGILGRGHKASLTHGGMEESGLTLGGPSWLQRARRSASAVPMVLAPPRSASARGAFFRQTSNNKNRTGAGAHDPTGPRSPLNSGSLAARLADGATSPLTAEAEDEEQAAWPDSTVVAPGAGGGGGLAAAGMLTVHDLDETYESWGMRAHMGALVDSILSTTLRSSGAHLRGDDGGAGAEMAAARVTEGLEELQLSAVLGQGASGVVLRGTLGCTPVAVKIMEMPDADASVGGQGTSQGGGGGRALLQSSDEEGGGGGCEGGGSAAGSQAQLHGNAAGEPREVRARRALLRNAMEVALMRSISHVNIVQAFGVYDNVIMERHEGRQGIISLRRINQKDANDQKVPDATAQGSMRRSPICTAIVMELCDRGSLADVLHSRSFPALPLPPPHPSAMPAATAGAAMQYARYWKGVYMTLLEIALALRHLHSRRLVHRDLKPGNILLKSSPGDPRGWTCKLADFGFALVLDQLDQSVAEECGQAAASHGCVFGGGSSSSSSYQLPTPPPASLPSVANGIVTGNVGPRDWYTVQQHIGGTVTHMAPEAFKKGSRIDASVDVFSFGVIMWELVCGRGHRPHRDLTLDAISATVTGGTRPVFPPGDHVPLPFRQLARTCWSSEPRLRPSAAELVGIIKGLLESVRA